MKSQVYQDVPIKKSAAKRTRVLPRIRKTWDSICHIKDSMDDLYFQYRYNSFRNNEEFRQKIEANILEAVAPCYRKKDLDFDYVMQSLGLVIGKVLATEECEEAEPAKKFESTYFMNYFDLDSAANLQGYLALRTRLRRYEYVDTKAYSLLHLYAFELLNLIGVEDEHEALKRLAWLYEQYGVERAGETDAYASGSSRWRDDSVWERNSLRRDLKRWIIEFGWYYGCDDDLGVDRDKFYPVSIVHWQISMLEKAEKLKNVETLSDDELVERVLDFAGADAIRSAFRKKYQADFDAIIAKLYREMDTRTRRRCGTSWIEKHTKHVSGFRDKFSFFSGVKFFDEEYENQSVGRAPIEAPFYKICFPKQLSGTRRNTYSITTIFLEYPTAKLRSMLKYLDYTLRKRTKFKPQIKMPEIMKSDMNLVDKAINAYLVQKREAEVQARLEAIKINPQAIENIRSDAEVTRDSLLVEDELEDAVEEVVTAKSNEIDVPDTPDTSLRLTPQETELIKRLVNGEKCQLSSLEVDQINEKFYDLMGDNILEFDNSGVILYNEYIDDVKRLLG